MNWGIATISAFMILMPLTARAGDGSGFATAVPNAVIAGSNGNQFLFTYTATEDMGNGAVRMTTPDGFPNPTPQNTTVTVVDGLSADIIDDLEANPLPEGTPGWNATEGVPLLDLVTVNADSDDFFAGSRSLEVNFLVSLGVLNITNPRVWFNYAANDARNWSGYTHFSFMVKLSTLLAANIDLGQAELLIAEDENLNGAVGYNLSSALIDIDLLEGGEWAQVIVDLRSHAAGTRDGVLSYGLRFPTVSAGVVTSLNLDHFMAGPGSPIFNGNTVTEPLMFLNEGGKVIFDYHDITAPGLGTYTFEHHSQMDASGDLAEIGDHPEVNVVDPSQQCNVSADPDADGSGEFAIDEDCDGCFGDAYLDPDASSNACINADGSNDSCEDFFIDTDATGCEECPDVFWDPTNGVISRVSRVSVDVNGDGTPEQVCAYDSDGDGEDDSFINPDPDNPNVGETGGQGAGLPNPFHLSGVGCALSRTETSAAGAWALGWFLILTSAVSLKMASRARKETSGRPKLN